FRLAVLPPKEEPEGMLRKLVVPAVAAANAQSRVDLEFSGTVRQQIFDGGRALPFVTLVERIDINTDGGIGQVRLVRDERDTRNLLQRIEKLLGRVLRLESGVKSVP